ncbi:P-type conjugative transfer protein TrbL [Pseudomonas putida S610]|uniref:P-type conjugative transfer protein TrbL n=1 Tax=Pseudomonas putida group TaxID=136845 RepID=UPI0003C5E9D0|nr:P-type conjugative transfer protein TrbL [Pseudomonas putida]EST17548.1 P-type conjugative transfer protein TrbL [Pseudomonas putida S610]
MMSERQMQRLGLGLFILVLAFPTLAHAATDQLGNAGIMDEVLDRFHSATGKWLPAIQAAASRLFFALATISMVWTFGMLLMRKAEIGEFFAELIRFMVVFGFYWWLLTNAMEGLKIADTIVKSLSQLGAEAGKLGTTELQPSTIVDLGFELYDKTVEATNKLSWREMGRQLTMEGMAIGILLVLAVVSINLLVLLASSWFLLFAGVFFLGFAGSKWTSDIALNYFRAVLGVGAQLFAMVLLVAIGKDFIESFAARISDKMAVQELAVMLVSSVLLLLLVNKIPPMIAALVGGAGGASGGIGNFSAGALVGAATTAASMASKGASAVMSGGANLVGGAQAVHAAFKGAQSSVASGSDISSRMAGMFGGGGSSGSSSTTSSNTASNSSPLGSVMGLTSSSTSGSGSLQSASSRGGDQMASNAMGGAAGEGAAQNGSTDAGPSSSDSSASGGAMSSASSSDSAGQAGTGTSSKADSGGTANSGTKAGSSSQLGNAGRVALQTAANLISGSGRVAQARVDKSLGGKLAQAVSSSGQRTSGNLDTQSKSRDFNPDAEVKSFSERKQDLT